MNKSLIIKALPRIIFGILTAWGGVMHYTVDVAVWQNPFLTSLYDTHYLWQIIGVINCVAGVLLIFNRFTLLSLLILLPITLNIFLYHFFYRTPDGLYIGIPMIALNLWCVWEKRAYFKPILKLKLEE